MTADAQRLPSGGRLAANMGKSLAELCQHLGNKQEPACSYVVMSVSLNEGHFQQKGSGPNFQGGRLTLCTCKHQMRASREAWEWEGAWIVGFTSRAIHDGCHWLFYLARVKQAFGSQYDLWTALPDKVRSAKSAVTNFLGDVFEPCGNLAEEERLNPAKYVVPSRHAHRKNNCDSGWHNDIRYKHMSRHRRPPSLLLCDPHFTFIWQSPKIFLKEDHCRDFRKWAQLSDLIEQLKDG